MKHLFVVGGRARTYLDSERNRCTGDMSPPSDNVIFDNQCYATTPSSSNGNSDMEQPTHCNSRRCNGSQAYQQQNMQSVSTPGSPTSRLLLEYEMHLRNTLAKGMDAESYSLRTFEALLTQSMEDLGEFFKLWPNLLPLFFHISNLRFVAEFAKNIPLNTQRTPHVSRRRKFLISFLRFFTRFQSFSTCCSLFFFFFSPTRLISREIFVAFVGSSSNKSSTLPLSYRYERQNSKDRDGYYSDRNEMIREKRDREIDRDRGYLSDYNSRQVDLFQYFFATIFLLIYIQW